MIEQQDKFIITCDACKKQVEVWIPSTIERHKRGLILRKSEFIETDDISSSQNPYGYKKIQLCKDCANIKDIIE
jgi:hypothetical protein